MFTSGSTGQPKGVEITRGCLESFLTWIFAEHSFKEGGEVFLNQAPFSFDVSIMDLYPALLTGSTVVSVTREDIASPAQLFRLLYAAQPTVWVSTPSFAQLCIPEPSFAAAKLPGLNCFLFCGETLSKELSAQLIQRFPAAEVWNTYGPTEATVATTSIRVEADLLQRYAAVPIGRSMLGSEVLVMDEARRPLPEKERGEIVIIGPNVSPGYLGRPDLTEKVFFEYQGQRAYCTGDVGYSEDGLLFCEGRRDAQIKLHGYRIELGDIEANLRALPGVRDAVVLPKLKDGRPESLAAFVVMQETGAGTESAIGRELKKQLAALLPLYMVPQRFFIEASFPMNTNGKADRKKLAEKLS